MRTHLVIVSGSVTAREYDPVRRELRSYLRATRRSRRRVQVVRISTKQLAEVAQRFIQLIQNLGLKPEFSTGSRFDDAYSQASQAWQDWRTRREAVIDGLPALIKEVTGINIRSSGMGPMAHALVLSEEAYQLCLTSKVPYNGVLSDDILYYLRRITEGHPLNRAYVTTVTGRQRIK